MNIHSTIVVFIFASSLWSQPNDSSINVNRYYPLAVGNIWKYQLGESEESISTREIIVHDEKYNLYIAEEVTRIAYFSPIIKKELIEKRDNYILILSIRGVLDHDFRELIPPEIIIKYPLSIGSTWSNKNDYQIEEFEIIEFLSYKVKAGQFDNVCKIIRKIWIVDLDYKTEFGTSILYFAPNIGLIKEEFGGKGKEPSTLMELVEYQIK